jgi:hypothetical protein
MNLPLGTNFRVAIDSDGAVVMLGNNPLTKEAFDTLPAIMKQEIYEDHEDYGVPPEDLFVSIPAKIKTEAEFFDYLEAIL